MQCYFILDSEQNRVKIGRSNNVEVRKKILQTGCSNSLTIIANTNKYAEKELHQKFHRYRIRKTEWFTFSAEIKCFLIRLNSEE